MNVAKLLKTAVLLFDAKILGNFATNAMNAIIFWLIGLISFTPKYSCSSSFLRSLLDPNLLMQIGKQRIHAVTKYGKMLKEESKLRSVVNPFPCDEWRDIFPSQVVNCPFWSPVSYSDVHLRNTKQFPRLLNPNMITRENTKKSKNSDIIQFLLILMKISLDKWIINLNNL